MSTLNKFLPKLEILLILLFFIVFIVWAIPKCSKNKATINEPEKAQESVTDTVLNQKDTLPKLVINLADSTKTENNEPFSQLYVTIDELKLRRGPHLDSTLLIKLPLFSKVYFLNEVTDFRQEINLGYEMANEPWIKVRTKQGIQGWVYGAGVNYYKKKRDGVWENE